MSGRHSSSSAPAIRRARSAHAADGVRPELPSAALTASAAFFQPMSRLSRFGLQRVLDDSEVRSQPLRPIPRAYAHRAALPKLRCLRYQRQPLERGVPHSQASRTTAPYSAFNRGISSAVRLMTLTVLRWAAGPVRQSGRTHCQGLVSKATLCSFCTSLT